MGEKLMSVGHSRRIFLRFAAAFAVGLSLLISLSAASTALAQTSASVTGSTELPGNWRDIKDGVGGYPAGPMLEIALRRTLSDKLEMFKWRSEFIAMLSAQPDPLVEREWHSIWAFGHRNLNRYDLVGESAEVAGHGQHALYEPGCREVASNTQHDINFRQAARQPFRPSDVSSVRHAGARTGPAGLSCYRWERRCCS